MISMRGNLHIMTERKTPKRGESEMGVDTGQIPGRAQGPHRSATLRREFTDKICGAITDRNNKNNNIKKPWGLSTGVRAVGAGGNLGSVVHRIRLEMLYHAGRGGWVRLPS